MSNETLVEFEHWFLENYPADCIISKPAWHAPKIYRAATYSLEKRIASIVAENQDMVPRSRLNAVEHELAEVKIDRNRILQNAKTHIEELNAKLERAHIYIRHQPYKKDFACYDCDPMGDMVVAGFVCAFHEAQS